MNHIKCDRCDSCGQKTSVVVYHHYGTPVLNQCKQCNPYGYKTQAQEDINSWLKGKQ
jgi:hypothetical protein